MLKKLLLICLLLNSATMGLQVVQAEEITPTQATESTQINDQLQPSQIVESEEQYYSNEDEIGLNDPEVDQDQSADSTAHPVQNIEGDYEEADQDQTANNNVCQDQTVQASVACRELIDSDVDGQIGQGQTTNLTVSQEQAIKAANGITVNQNLKAGIDSEQTQGVLLPDDEIDILHQDTQATTDQLQSVLTENGAEIEFTQGTDITVAQLQDLDADGEKADEQEQLTVIEAGQKLEVESNGSAILNQVQAAIVNGLLVNTLTEVVQVGVTVTTQNYLEVIKDTTGEFVKFVQKIFVNDQLIDDSSRTTALDAKNVHGAFQSYEKEFDWGKVIVKNVAVLFLNDQTPDYKAFLKSGISLVFGAELFGGPEPKPTTPPGGDDEEPTTPPDDNNGEEPTTPPDDNQGGEPTNPPIDQLGENPTPVSSNSDASTPSVVKAVTSATPVKTATTPASKANELPNTATNHYNLLLFGIVIVAAGSVLILRKSKKFTI